MPDCLFDFVCCYLSSEQPSCVYCQVVLSSRRCHVIIGAGCKPLFLFLYILGMSYFLLLLLYALFLLLFKCVFIHVLTVAVWLCKVAKFVDLPTVPPPLFSCGS